MKIGSESWNRLIINGANDFGIHLERKELIKFSLYAKELILWNKKINLTSITDPFEIAVNHFLDSIVPSLYIHSIHPSSSIIDIGSGGGFPGIPLAILFPYIHVTLIDSSRKKISFLKHIARSLKLSNLSICQINAEDIAKNRKFDYSNNVIVSRALFPLEKLISITIPLMSQSGEIIAMKGKSVNEEKQLKAVLDSLCDWEKESDERSYTYSIKKYKLYKTGAERSIFNFKFKS